MRFKIRWSDVLTAYKITRPNYEGGEVVDAADYDALEADLKRVMANVRNYTLVERPLWACVMETFGFGSTRAHEMCRRFGYDPDEVMPPRTCGEHEYCVPCERTEPECGACSGPTGETKR